MAPRVRSAIVFVLAAGCAERGLDLFGAAAGAGATDAGSGIVRDGGSADDPSRVDLGKGVADGGAAPSTPFTPVGVPSCARGLPPAKMPRAAYDIGATSGLDGRLYLFNLGADGAQTQAYAYTPGPSSWTRLPDVPGHLNGTSSPVRVGDRIFAISNLVFAYTPGTNEWASRTAVAPERVGMAATAGRDGKIYASGGVRLGEQGGSKSSFSYDPLADAWTIEPDRPQIDGFAGMATGADGLIYVVGEHTEAWSEQTAAWQTLPDPPTPRVNPGVVAIGDAIYTFGGREPSQLKPSAAVEAYHPATATWTVHAPMPVGSNHASAALACDGQVHVFGGVGQGGHILDKVQAYDPIADTWQVSP